MQGDDASIEYQYYELKEITILKPKPGEFRLVNAAVGSCGLCSAIITGMGGSPHMICIKCGDLLQAGKLRGCVKYDYDEG